MTSDYNPTDDELRGLIRTVGPYGLGALIRNLASLVLREREEIVSLTQRAVKAEMESDDLRNHLEMAEAERDSFRSLFEAANTTAGRYQDERDALARWKAEAMTALHGWEGVWRELGKPGPLGGFKWELCITEIRRREAECDQAEAELVSREHEWIAQWGLMNERAVKAEAVRVDNERIRTERDSAWRERDQARAALARVEALCDDEDRIYAETYPHAHPHFSAVLTARVRAAITGDPPAAGYGAGMGTNAGPAAAEGCTKTCAGQGVGNPAVSDSTVVLCLVPQACVFGPRGSAAKDGDQ